jgi:hypothetical protein
LQLLRLNRFTPEQQQLIALLRLQETQLRPLHEAINSGRLNQRQVDEILTRLKEIAAERADAHAQEGRRANQDAIPEYSPPEIADKHNLYHAQEEGVEGILGEIILQRGSLDGPTIARQVARAIRSTESGQHLSAPRWLTPFNKQLIGARKAVRRAQDRIAVLDDINADKVLQEVEQLTDQLTSIAQILRRNRERRTNEKV